MTGEHRPPSGDAQPPIPAAEAASAPSFDLTGRLAVVTGASRGIGAGLARALSRAGTDIIGVSRSGNDALTAQLVGEQGKQYYPITLDLADPRSVSHLLERIHEIGRPVDILINNAGIAHRNPAEVHADDQWSEVIAVNLTAPFMLARAIGSQMLARGSGKIIFLGSMMTWQGGRNIVSYSASKAGVAGVVRSLANEWAGRGVNVNAIAPGYITTDLTSSTHSDPLLHQAFLDRIPAGRWGTPDDLAGAAVFLSSSASDYVNGVVLPVDGGWLVR